MHDEEQMSPEEFAAEQANQDAMVTVEPTIPAALAMVDPEKLAAIREKLSKFKKKEESGTTISGSEAVEEDRPKGDVIDGKDVDWSEYELEFNMRHLYPKARFMNTPQGPKWVVMIDEFYSTEKEFKQHGQDCFTPGSQETMKEPRNAGEYLGDMLNSPEGWRLISMLPSSTGRIGLVLQRQAPMALPDPKEIKKTTEVDAPSDPELQRTEDAAMKFMEEEGLTPEQPAEDTGGGEPTPSVPPGTLEAAAIAANGPADYVPNDLASTPKIRGDLHDLRVDARQAGQDAERALGGGDFGEV